MNLELPTLTSRMKTGEFLTIAQLHPPRKDTFENFSTIVDHLEENGTTIFDINASPDPTRMGSFDTAARISRDNRIIIPHATTRDSLESTFHYAEEAYDKHNTNHLLVVKGDKPKEGDFKTDVQTLMTSLADITTPEGKKKFVIVGAVNQNSKDLDAEAERMQQKADRGTDIFMSQLVLDKEQAKRLGKLNKKPLLAGISALKKIGDIPGVVIPEKIDSATEIVKFIKDNHLAQGIYIAAPITLTDDFVQFMKEITEV